MKIKTEFDTAKVIQRFSQYGSAAQKKLDAVVLQDSNYFCPLDTGTLQKSGIIHSVLGSGLLEWKTPYARSQYYDIKYKKHDRNPNATMKWFESAKARYLEKWRRLIHAEYGI